MLKRSKIGWLAAALLLALGLASAFALRTREAVPPAALGGGGPGVRGRTTPDAETSPHIPAQSEKPAESRRSANAPRHDADFWPQVPHPIALRRRTVVPSAELSDDALRDPKPHVWLLQFGGPLEAADRAELLKSHRIEILCSSADMCVHARATANDLGAAIPSPPAPLPQGERGEQRPALLGWARLDAADKLLDAGMESSGQLASVRVELYPGGDIALVKQRASELGATILKSGANWFEAQRTFVRDFALALAALDDVYVIEAGRPAYVLHDVESEDCSNATPLFSSPYNLDGSGLTVMVRDDGRIFAHPDFAPRLLLGPDVTNDPTTQHSTHVAGTIGGDGSSIPAAGARGFATGSLIVSYDLSGDESAEPLAAKQNFNAVLSNHSYGFVTGWDSGVFHNNQATFGLYSTFARNWDALVRANALIMIKSAGNDRADTGPGHPHDGTLGADGEYYNTVDETGTGKNELIVGAVTDSAQAGSPTSAQLVMSFSSSGPTQDGRLRPEIVANGDTLISCDNTPVTGATYVVLSGTSQAAAVVSGATALFLQRYRQYFGASAFATPHYVRAVYAQTATDYGRPGPDFLHGFGMLDLQAAINLLDADAGTGARVMTSTIDSTTPERFFLFTSDGVTPIKATLCWTDDAGDALAQKALVNDLDLRLVKADDQTAYFPFTLSATSPEQPAKPGINSVDTIEQVVLQAPVAGNYLLAVRGTTLISSTDFALASSHVLTEVIAPTPMINASKTSGQPPLFVGFDGSTSTAAPGSAITQYIWSFGDGASAEGATVNHIYPLGTYQAALKVIDDKGASASTSVTIAVANKLPVAVLDASPSSGDAPLNVMFTSTGSFDPDGTISTFAWDFGDGTSGSGATVSHTFAATGLYWCTLSVTDNAGGVTSASKSVFVGQQFTPSTGRFSVNFAKTGKDSMTVVTHNLAITPNLTLLDLSGEVRLGETVYPFVLDAKGNFHFAPLTVKLNPLHAQLTVSLAGTDLKTALSSSNVANVTVKGEKVYVPFAVTFDNGMAFGSTGLDFSYTARQDTTGRGTFIKPPPATKAP